MIEISWLMKIVFALILAVAWLLYWYMPRPRIHFKRDKWEEFIHGFRRKK